MVASPLDDFLKRHTTVFLDTSTLIYFVENHPRYHSFCEVLFDRIETGKTGAATSTLTLLEVLVQPYRRNKDDLVMKFYALLTSYPHLTWIPLTLTVADHAAKLRADHRLKTPDAVQAASAIIGDATGFICNDAVFKKIIGFETLVIDECV